MLRIDFDRKSGVPLYMQIKESIRDLISNGRLKSERLPAERELAETLEVSRNTVSMAYHELENDGYIDTQVGRGTFIVSSSGLSQTNREMILKKAIEHSVEEGLTLGFSLEEYQSIAEVYLKEKKEMLEKTIIVFVECNKEQLKYFSAHLDFSAHLEVGPHIAVLPVLLSDLRQNKSNLKIEQADLIVTSFFHLEEVESQIRLKDKKVLGISLTPEIGTIIKVARISPEATVGIVTSSKEFLTEVKKSLKDAGMKFNHILSTFSTDKNEIKELVNASQAVLVSPSRCEEVQKLTEQDQKVIEFLYTPDEASINNLKIALLEGKEIY